MAMGQRVGTGVGHGGITCVLQTQFSSFSLIFNDFIMMGLTLISINVLSNL